MRESKTCTVMLLCGLLTAPMFAKSTCEVTAANLLKASRYDVVEGYYEAIAICRNLGESEDRRACREEAWEERQESGDELLAQFEARLETCELLGENRYAPDPLEDPRNVWIEPDDIGYSAEPNPYLDLTEGRTWVVQSDDETIVVTVTDDTEEINGVPCRRVVDAVVEAEDENGEVDYEPVEVTDDYFAQEASGDVYYCGEISRNWEEGLLTDLDGSFRSGFEGAKGGLLIRALPMEGESFRQEWAVNEAEDVATTISVTATPSAAEGGDHPTFPCSGTCLQAFEYTPLEPESSEYKYYRPGVGFVVAVGLEDGQLTGDREELTCVGDSLDVLQDAQCEIEDLEALLDALCEQSDAFCEDDDD